MRTIETFDMGEKREVVNKNLKRIKSAEEICGHPEHSPPEHLHLEPGRYEWTCPKCKTVTTINKIILGRNN